MLQNEVAVLPGGLTVQISGKALLLSVGADQAQRILPLCQPAPSVASVARTAEGEFCLGSQTWHCSHLCHCSTSSDLASVPNFSLHLYVKINTNEKFLNSPTESRLKRATYTVKIRLWEIPAQFLVCFLSASTHYLLYSKLQWFTDALMIW